MGGMASSAGGQVPGNIPLDPTTGLPATNVFNQATPTAWNKFQAGMGQVGRFGQKLNPLLSAIPGFNPQQQQQQQRQQAPVNFNIPAQPYVPPPQAINPFQNTNFGQF